MTQSEPEKGSGAELPDNKGVVSEVSVQARIKGVCVSCAELCAVQKRA